MINIVLILGEKYIRYLNCFFFIMNFFSFIYQKIVKYILNLQDIRLRIRENIYSLFDIEMVFFDNMYYCNMD